MFAYIEKDSYLHRRNPMIKLIIIAVYTIVVCLSYYPALPILLFVYSFIGTWLAGKIPLDNLFRRMLLFLAVSLIFIVSMLVLTGLDNEPDIEYRLWFFKWTTADLNHAIVLGFRILAIVTMSMSFVLTTRPRNLVLSLINQCKISVVHGYATMATYRFLPELQSQVDKIHLAQEIRGIPWNKGVMSRFTSPFRVLLPLLCVAARRGERIACAMESRGLGRDNERTYYVRTEIDRNDKIFLITSLILFTIVVAVLAKFNMFRLNFASIK